LGFAEDAAKLIEQKKFEELETLWMSEIERDPSDAAAFVRTAKLLRKAEQRTQSDTLLALLSDTLVERKLWAQRLLVLQEMGRLSSFDLSSRQP